MKNDQYADIAAGGVNTGRKGLEEICPERINVPILSFQKDVKPAVFGKKMDTREELYREVEQQKLYYEPYMKKMAPLMQNFRLRKELEQFGWRIAEASDWQDFSRVVQGKGKWQQVKIPHYGAPLGNKTTWYRTTFRMEAGVDESVFLHFDGVDYIANVYINGILAGAHEGFFAAFEFDITKYLKSEENILVVEVKNDFAQKRSQKSYGGEMFGGDKMYAATGPGYDDPQMGWHHCPPGMGIYQSVWLERRKRCFIQDIFVRPQLEQKRGELWLEIYKCDPGYEDVTVEYSLYGRNFKCTVFEGSVYSPYTSCEIGMGDSFTEAQLTAEGKIDKPVKLYMEKGMNYLRIPFEIPDCRLWTPDRPYLYEMQVILKTAEGKCLDGKSQSFGMRDFRMDEETEPKGSFYLNGEKIRLRGANTMGNEQQCVMKGDYQQLLEDLLLAKVCNMNFLRLTQRPVQDIVYEYCDMLGLMTQTDLPLFGVLRRNKFSEAVRQAEEMEKLVRRHPCNIVVSYINEPFPNAYNQPHRHLDRAELMDFFVCADKVVKMNNPDQVIKHVDGDYDPPSLSLPDNHCYTCWYNGCGVESGALHKGYWLPVRKGWNYGCGEFGAEGLDQRAVMEKYYPGEWLPHTEQEEKSWTPSQIISSQTGNFHRFFYDTQHSLDNWIEESQKHQAWASKWMTEAFRRNRRMVSFAIHLFIDAFPAGWMKAIMDVDRNPKKAYFAYRDALTPVMVSLRTDRFSCYTGEKIPVELWVCNDLPTKVEDYQCYYEVTDSVGNVKHSGRTTVITAGSDSRCIGVIEVPAEDIEGSLYLRAALQNEEGRVIHTNQVEIQVYEKKKNQSEQKIFLIDTNGEAAQLLRDIGYPAAGMVQELALYIGKADEKAFPPVILADSYQAYEDRKAQIDTWVSQGARLIFLELPPGEYQILSTSVKVQYSSMLPMNYVSVSTGHPMTAGFREKAFWNWYDKSADMITPLLESTISGEGIVPILTSGNTDEQGNWETAIAAGELRYKEGCVMLCQIKLAGRVKENPAAGEFFRRLLSIC